MTSYDDKTHRMWARWALKTPETTEIRGQSYETISRRMSAVCAEAAVSGRTKAAAYLLSRLVDQLEIRIRSEGQTA